MALLSDVELSQSDVVANCRMNRERVLRGGNGYVRELGLDPVEFLSERLKRRSHVAWLDLCCGAALALGEAAGELGDRAKVIGVDLVVPHRVPDGVELIEANLASWRPKRRFDLVTCVHGLHYVGDKLGLIARAAGWLESDGLFVATLDPANLRLADGRPASRVALAALRRAGFQYDRRRHVLIRRGAAKVEFGLRYLGGDDAAGPNFSGQPAVNSHYAPANEG